MKKLFRYLAAALLVGTSFAAASCSDDPEEPTIPQFPTPLPQQTILPGESYSFTIEPNMEWVVSIPEDARNWFYLDDNGTKVSKLRGAAVETGEKVTVKVGAENVEIFDAVPPVEVTLALGNPAVESRTIASFVIQQKERELKFYMAKTEDGEYLFNEDSASPLQYSYEAEAKTEGAVKLEEHGAFYSARLLVESNVAWTVSVPEWVDVRVNAEAATSGAAGQSEVELRANYAKMPLEGAADVACPFNAATADGSLVELAKISITLESLAGVLEYELPEEALFSPRGNYLANASTYGASLNASITAPDGVQIIAIAKAMYGGYEEWMGQPWVKAEIDPWSGEDKIQTRNVSISLEPNTGTMERQAVIFVLPASLKDKTMFDLLTEEMYDVREEYRQYLATSITQEASMFLLNPQNSLAMKQQGVTFELGYDAMFDSTLWQWNDWMHNDNALYYKLTYTNEYSADGGAIDVVPVSWCPAYTSYKIYGYNAGSAGENLPADNKWLQLKENRNGETNVVESFTVQMNFDEEYTNYYGDGKKYAAVVFYDETGTAIATLECAFDDGSGSGGGTTGAVNFAYPQYAQMEGSSIEQLSAGDPDYDKYFTPYADYTPSIYRVTFRTANPMMSTIVGLPDYGQWSEVIDGADWLSRPTDVGEVNFNGSMNSQKSAKGACIFYSGGTRIDDNGNFTDPVGPAVILVVNLVLE